MDSRNPSDKKRRIIEGLLSSGKSQEENPRDLDQITREISADEIEEELEFVAEIPDVPLEDETTFLMQDDYESTGIAQDDEEVEGEGGDDDSDPPDFSSPTVTEPEEKKSRVIQYVAIAIVVIGITSAGLILARDQVFGFFASFGGIQHEEKDQSDVIDELEDENKRLTDSLSASRNDSVEIRNLRTANDSLQSMLNVEKEKSQRFEAEINELSNPDGREEIMPSGELQVDEVDQESRDLRDRLESESDRADSLAEQLQDLNRRMINYSRENSRLNEELRDSRDEVDNLQYLRRENSQLRNKSDTLSRQLRTANSQVEVLQSNADEYPDSSAQLEKVNLEYRQVLGLLQESRDANNNKQKKVDELLVENGSLQTKVSRLEKSKKSRVEQFASNDNSSSKYSYSSSDSGLVAPYPLDIVRPQYPSSAWRRKVEGIVTLRVYVDRYGDVTEAKVISSPDRLRSLDRAALSAVKQWKFMPGKRKGRPVDMWHDIPLEFTRKR